MQHITITYFECLIIDIFFQLHLGDFPDARFTEKKVQNMISQFRSALCIIEKQIKERNAEIETPYIYLLPSRIPNSISI